MGSVRAGVCSKYGRLMDRGTDWQGRPVNTEQAMDQLGTAVSVRGVVLAQSCCGQGNCVGQVRSYMCLHVGVFHIRARHSHWGIFKRFDV